MDYNDLPVGQAIQSVPLGDMIRNLAHAIADAQWAMDQRSIETAAQLATRMVDLHRADGTTAKKSLLELGFTPTFYQFQEATIELSVTISMHVEEETRVSASATLGGSRSSSSTTHERAPGSRGGGAGAADPMASGDPPPPDPGVDEPGGGAELEPAQPPDAS